MIVEVPIVKRSDAAALVEELEMAFNLKNISWQSFFV